MGVRGVVAAVVSLAVVATPAVARATPGAIAWVRAEGAERCPDGDAVRARVAARLGRAPDPSPHAIEVVAARIGRSWRASMFVRRPDGELVGERALHVEGDDCEPLVAAASLVIALAIDPEAATRPTPAPAIDPPPAAPIVAPAPPVARSPAPRPRPRGEVSLGPYAALGVVPALALGVALDALVPVSARWGFALGARWLPAVSSREGAVDFGWAALRAGACWAPVVAPMGALRVCADVRAGVLRAGVLPGATLVPDAVGERAWVGGALSLAGRVRLVGPLFVRGEFELQAPITRDDFVITRQRGVAEAFQQPAITGAATLALGATI